MSPSTGASEPGGDVTWKISDGRLDYLVVFVDVGAEAVPVGALTFEGKRRQQSYFTYARSWLSYPDRFQLAPVGLPARPRAVPSAPHEVPLPFVDAAPDGWGRGVLQQAFPGQQFGMGEFLAASGDNRTGWFRFGHDPKARPEQWVPAGPVIEMNETVDLPALVAAAEAADRGEPTRSDLMMLYRSSSDVGGARPKARIHHEGRDWIAKFQAWGDAFNEPCAEALCLTLAKAAGIETPEHRVVSIGSKTVLLVERFDRSPKGSRLGYVSAGTLVGSAATTYGTDLSYLDIAVKAREVGIRPCEDLLFQRLLFNALIHNTDDHLRNHAFIGDHNGWRLSPVFDIVPQRSAHMVLRPLPGRDPVPDPVAISQAAGDFGIHAERAEQIIAGMTEAFGRLEEYLDENKISRRDRELLADLMPYAFTLPAELAHTH